MHGLGFADNEMQKPVKEFSGGWRMRLNLAQALICTSDPCYYSMSLPTT